MNTGPLSTRARLADLALAVYLAPILEGRRVAVVGPTSGEVARRARALGAHTVVSFGGIGDDIAVRALVPGALASMYGKVDVIVVPDAGSVPSLPAVLDEARRALGSEGVVVIASEPEEGPVPLEAGAKPSVGFYDLEDLCLARFANVRMLGRGPFVGYTVASLDEGSDDVSLDTRLIDGDPPRPEAFIAVASDSEVVLEPLAVVQVPGDVLTELRASATRALEDEVAKRDQKLKELEAASAERWVKIQRYEHGLKELEEENRKARDKTVRMSKELEDERKLRQRIELEAQMARRAPELPKTPDLEPELRKLREQAERAERDVAAARSESEALRKQAAEAIAATAQARKQTAEASAAADAARKQAAEAGAAVEHARKQLADAGAASEALRANLAEASARAVAATSRVGDLERELDETQSAEAELRTQLDEALERAEVIDLTPEVDRLKSVVDALRAEVEGTRAELAASQVEAARLRDAVPVDGEHERLERALSQHSAALSKVRAERAQMEQAVRELTMTLSDVMRRDHVEEAAELRSRLSSMASVHAALVERADGLAADNAALRERVAQSDAAAVAAAGDAQQARWRAAELEGLAVRPAEAPPSDELLAAVEAQRQEALAARGEVARLFAVNVGLEARLVHTTMELEGARAGYARRVAELERELERLMKALEVAAAQTSFERDATLASLQQQAELAQAEREGLSFRLREAEAALVAASLRPAPAAHPAVDNAGLVDALRTENATLATQLTDAERALDELRAQPRAVSLDEPDDAAAQSHARLEQVLSDMSATAARLAATEEELARTRQELESARNECETLVAPEEIVEMRAEIDALVRRCDDLSRDRERRVADIEVLIAQVTDRDLRLSALERRREEELMGAQRLIMMEAQANRSLRTSLDDVRSGLSAILVDGRGAMVAHDLMTLLRRIEEAG
jgi:chromosome segregation ATPase